MLYLVLFLASVLGSVGILFAQPLFFQLAKRSLGLLNELLEGEKTELEKYLRVTKALLALLNSLVLFVASFIGIGLVVLLPLYLYQPDWEFWKEPHLQKGYVIGVLLVGGLIPFAGWGQVKKNGVYNAWSKLLHQLVLDNENLSKQLFFWEWRSYHQQVQPAIDRPYVIVTGLARAGTTALTQQLFQLGGFHSLAYTDMPFLLSPNRWRWLVGKRRNTIRERAHGDRVLLSLDSVEALEEYFFRVFLQDSYIGPEALHPHQVSLEIADYYLKYQQLLGIRSTHTSWYLAKNNNFLLRYECLREHHPQLRVICLLRDPFTHAASLLRQHRRFSKFQQQDPFILEYMNWLGHHEFGLHHKPFVFGETPSSNHSTDDIHYWLERWIDYYRQVGQLCGNNGFYLVAYESFSENPQAFLQKLTNLLGRPCTVTELPLFEQTIYADLKKEIESSLRQAAVDLYTNLRRRCWV